MKEAGVPISFTDFEIENLMPYPQIKDGKPIKKTMLFVKDFAVRDIIATNAGYKFEKKLFMPIKKETLPRKYRLLFPGDMDYIPPQYYVRRIPKKYWVKLPEEYLLPPEDFGKIVLPNYHGKKPIYFAVTVSRDGTRGYESHLRMEGLVKRLVPDGGGFDMERTDSLLNKVYRYRGVFDPSVYKDETTRKILSNYAVAYFALGTEEKRRGEIDRAIDSFEKGQGIGVKEIPFAALLAELYRMKGDYKKVGEILRKAAVNEKTPYSLYALGGLYLDNGKYAQADSCFRKIIKLDEKSSLGYAGLLSLYTLRGNRDSLNQLKNKIVTNPELTGRVVSVLRSQKKGEMAVSLLSRWIEVHPYDTIAKGILKQIEKE
jgi:tetratricopeptide (TPR) repeat protein